MINLNDSKVKDLIKKQDNLSNIFSFLILIIYFSFILVIAFNPFILSQKYGDSDIIESSNGQIYGAEPKAMNANGSFYVDYLKGRLHFSSNCVGKTVTLHVLKTNQRNKF